MCALAREISEAQRREIVGMRWLLADIKANGEARTAAEAADREVPIFDAFALRDCPGA